MKGILIGIFILATFLFAAYFFDLFPNKPAPEENFIHPEYVRGSAIVHNHQVYTLNFDQQQKLLFFLNASKKETHPISSTPKANSSSEIEEIIIYLFDNSQFVLIPQEKAEIKHLLVTNKHKYTSLNLENYMGFNHLMQTTFDH